MTAVSVLTLLSVISVLTSVLFFILWLKQLKKSQKLEIQYAQLQAQQQERAQSFERESKQFEQQKQLLTEHFRLLSQEILTEKSQHLEQQSQKSLQHIIQPFGLSLESFKKEVQEIHHRESIQQGQLRQELNQLKALNQQITEEAQQLSKALRGQNKLQGNWGELILEGVLERAGLQEGKDFRREVSFTTEDGRKRPDAIVYLPENKHIIIDAKVSLNAYIDMVNEEDEKQREMAAKQHISSISQHIKELASKEYQSINELNSPEWVVMFIPIESAFADAIRFDEKVFQQALDQRILVTTPSTLLSSLQIIRQIWRYQEQNNHLSDVVSKAENIFKKLNTFLNSFTKIKAALDQAQNTYIQAENQLVQGRGNLVKQVNDFRKIAPNIHNSLPNELVEKAELEIEANE